MFGQPDHPSMSYAELVAMYNAKLAEGFRAEDSPPVTPAVYRFPEGTVSEKEHLVQAWNDGNNRLLEALKIWSEEDLDTHQLLHPAVGMLTIREMLFFTLHHNTLHWHDIEDAARAYSGV
jgi:hypothetical protein